MGGSRTWGGLGGSGVARGLCMWILAWCAGQLWPHASDYDGLNFETFRIFISSEIIHFELKEGHHTGADNNVIFLTCFSPEKSSVVYMYILNFQDCVSQSKPLNTECDIKTSVATHYFWWWRHHVEISNVHCFGYLLLHNYVVFVKQKVFEMIIHFFTVAFLYQTLNWILCRKIASFRPSVPTSVFVLSTARVSLFSDLVLEKDFLSQFG